MNWILSLLPIAIYLLVLKVLDSFSLARWKTLLLCMGYGICCCLLAFIFSTGKITPLIEELLKGGLVIFLISGKRIKFMPKSLIYGAATGAGFSLMENIICKVIDYVKYPHPPCTQRQI